jgi:hypothetical protein
MWLAGRLGFHENYKSHKNRENTIVILEINLSHESGNCSPIQAKNTIYGVNCGGLYPTARPRKPMALAFTLEIGKGLAQV